MRHTSKSFWSSIGKTFGIAYGVSLALLAVMTAVAVLATDYNGPAMHKPGITESGGVARFELSRTVFAVDPAGQASQTISVGGNTITVSNPVSSPNGRLTLAPSNQASINNLVGNKLITTRATQIDPSIMSSYIVRASGNDSDGSVARAWIKQNDANFASNNASFAEATWLVSEIQAASARHDPANKNYDYVYKVPAQVYRFTYGFVDNADNTYESSWDVEVSHPPTPLRSLTVSYNDSDYTAIIDFMGPRQRNGYSSGNELILRSPLNSSPFEPEDGQGYNASTFAALGDLKLISKNATGIYKDSGLVTGETYVYMAWAFDDGLKYSKPVSEILEVRLPFSPLGDGCTSLPVASGSNYPEILAGGTIRFTCALPDELIPRDSNNNPQIPTSIQIETFPNNGQLSESQSLYYLNGSNYTILLSKDANSTGRDVIEFTSIGQDLTFSFFLNSLLPSDPTTTLTNIAAGLHSIDFVITVNNNATLSGKLSDYYAKPTWRVAANIPAQINEANPECPYTTFDLLKKDYRYPTGFGWDMPNWNDLNSKCNFPMTFLDDIATGSMCGNGWIEPPGEECDDGNDISNDACSYPDCKRTRCGDGIVQNNPRNTENIKEECEPPNRGACSSMCQLLIDLPNCGNGIIEPPNEKCDDSGPTATCDAYCQIIPPGANTAVCGNGKKEGYEECDDGNLIAGDGCNAICAAEAPRAYCGDGIVQSPNNDGINEKCDDGKPTATCNASCEIINLVGGSSGGGESSGGDALSDGGTCGDFIGGVCGNFNCTDATRACDLASCSCVNAAVCGNSIIEPWGREVCDDGNSSSNDTCNDSCQLTVCGDNIVQASNGARFNEQCDDGNNNNNTDLCTNICENAVCGDGHIQAIRGEQCDDGAFNSADARCNVDCEWTYCGDGVVQIPNALGMNEQCDDKNNVNKDGCNSDCELEGGAPPLQQANCSAGVAGFNPAAQVCKDDCPAGQACNLNNCVCNQAPRQQVSCLAGLAGFNPATQICQDNCPVGFVCDINTCVCRQQKMQIDCSAGVAGFNPNTHICKDDCPLGQFCNPQTCICGQQPPPPPPIACCDSLPPDCNGVCPSADETCVNFLGEGCFCVPKDGWEWPDDFYIPCRNFTDRGLSDTIGYCPSSEYSCQGYDAETGYVAKSHCAEGVNFGEMYASFYDERINITNFTHPYVYWKQPTITVKGTFSNNVKYIWYFAPDNSAHQVALNMATRSFETIIDLSEIDTDHAMMAFISFFGASTLPADPEYDATNWMTLNAYREMLIYYDKVAPQVGFISPGIGATISDIEDADLLAAITDNDMAVYDSNGDGVETMHNMIKSVELRLNGKFIGMLDLGDARDDAIYVSFSNLPLSKGTNSIAIVARDMAGNEGSKIMYVYYIGS